MLKYCLAVALMIPMVVRAQNGNACQHIVVITPHPDDAEASCGGYIANATEAGDTVTILTMTGGELGIWGKGMEEARQIRTGEARNAAKVLGSGIVFFGAIDASLSVDRPTTEKLAMLLKDLHPDIVLAPWPMDVHSDHQATGVLAWRVFLEKGTTFALYFYETSNSPHTVSFNFTPTDYVDISKTIETKHRALAEQRSQHPEEWWGMYVQMAIAHGYAADVAFAEGYVKAQASSGLGGREAGTRRLLRP